MAEYFERSFSVAAVEKFKPHPDSYRMVANEMNTSLSDMCMVACHLWDTIGAQAVGCTGAFISRPHNSIIEAEGVQKPDLIARDIEDLADQLLKL